MALEWKGTFFSWYIYNWVELGEKSLMAKWLEQAYQWHEMDCHNLEVMSSNPSWVELGVRILLSQVVPEPKLWIQIVYLIWKALHFIVNCFFFLKFHFITISGTFLGILKGFHSSHQAAPTPMCVPTRTQVGHALEEPCQCSTHCATKVSVIILEVNCDPEWFQVHTYDIVAIMQALQ